MGSSGSANRMAREAEQREKEREARIRAGMSRIDETFKQFDDPFFNSLREASIQSLRPQLDDQYRDAHDGLVYALARSGNLNSSARTGAAAKLEAQRRLGLSRIDELSEGAVKQARSDIEDERATLVSMLQATADPENAANAAAARAGALRVRSPMQDLGPIIQNATAALATLNTPRYDEYGNAAPRRLSFGSRSSARTING